MTASPKQLDWQSSPLSKDDWLVLSLIKGVGPARLDRLYQYLKVRLEDHLREDRRIDQEDTNSCSRSELTRVLLLKLKWPAPAADEAHQYLQAGAMSHRVADQLALTQAWLAQCHDHHLLIRYEDAYPFMLKQISTAPLLLYIQGNLNHLNLSKLAIVGARKASDYGKQMAYHFAQGLSDQGLCVVSGGAIGIDTMAHRGALMGATPSISVMGAGLLNLYPKNNISLFNTLVEQGGCLISEYPLNTQVQARLFPARNRIISGLSHGVLVVEAGFKSGSLISARYALEQNRDVFAVPGRITDVSSQACLDLIRQGATLVTQVSDILDSLNVCVMSKEAMSTDVKQAFTPEPNAQSNLLSSSSSLPFSANNEPNISGKKYVYPSQSDLAQLDVSRETQAVSCQSFTPISSDLSDTSLKVIEFMDRALAEEKQRNAFEMDQLVDALSLSIEDIMQACTELELSNYIQPLMTGYARA